jgi:sugar phosphate isomerase/epimerase
MNRIDHIGLQLYTVREEFAYHNHHFEFFPLQGKLPYDILLERCDPDLVKMEMDFCWIAAVKQDSLIYFQRYPGRFPVVHVKQLTKLPARMPNDDKDPMVLYERVLPDITEVGEGVIDWKRIFSHSTQAGIQYFFVEHDVPQSPLASIKTRAMPTWRNFALIPRFRERPNIMHPTSAAIRSHTCGSGGLYH